MSTKKSDGQILYWLVVDKTHLKNMSSSIGMEDDEIFNIWKIEFMFQTTDQHITITLW